MDNGTEMDIRIGIDIDIKIGMKLYYAEIIPQSGKFNVDEYVVRTINKEDNWFCGVEKRTKQAKVFSFNHIGKLVFIDRDDALELVLKEGSE